MVTASNPTVPESPKTLAIQIQQLKDGIRHVVMFPKGTAVPGKARDIGMRDITTGGNRFWHNPEKIKASEIATAAKKNELPKILGNDGYGAPDKSELRGSTVAVVAETKQAVPVQDILADKQALPKAVKSAERLTPPGGSVKIKQPEEVIARRVQESPGKYESSPRLVQKLPDPNRLKQDAMKSITKLAAIGDIRGAITAGMQHVASGLLKPEHIDRAMDLAGEPAIKAAIFAVPHIHQAMQLFHSAKSEHQSVMRPVLVARLHAMERRSPQEQAAEMAHLKEHGLLPKENRI